MRASEALKTILTRSHAQAVTGQTVSMDEVEHFMNDKEYELGVRKECPNGRFYDA